MKSCKLLPPTPKSFLSIQDVCVIFIQYMFSLQTALYVPTIISNIYFGMKEMAAYQQRWDQQQAE